MCTMTEATIILETLADKILARDVFTVFDVTTEARKETDENIRHSDVRRIVNEEFGKGNLGDYDRDLCNLELDNNPLANVFYPSGKLASEHSLVSVDDSDDDNVVNADGSQTVTAEGRINVPKKLLDKVSSVAGSFDFMVNGTIVPRRPNADGRIRFSVEKLNLGDKVTLSADLDNNTIVIDAL